MVTDCVVIKEASSSLSCSLTVYAESSFQRSSVAARNQLAANKILQRETGKPRTSIPKTPTHNTSKYPLKGSLTMMMAAASVVRCAVLVSAFLLSVVNAASSSSPGWCKFSTAINHQQAASRHWRTSSDDVRLISDRRHKKVEVIEEREASGIEKALFGAIVIGGTTLVEYASGFLGAYMLGTVVGIPGLVYSKEGLAMGQRFGNMNARSVRWAKSWAPISAVFGGCDATTRVIRGNKKDQWNAIFSSAAAGAYFSRQGNIICVNHSVFECILNNLILSLFLLYRWTCRNVERRSNLWRLCICVKRRHVQAKTISIQRRGNRVLNPLAGFTHEYRKELDIYGPDCCENERQEAS